MLRVPARCGCTPDPLPTNVLFVCPATDRRKNETGAWCPLGAISATGRQMQTLWRATP
jgi:hypothetical protein